jgi:hypothetical protein
MRAMAPFPPSSDADERALVLVQTAGHQLGRRYPLGKHTMILGRDPACDVPIEDRRVSRQHARIEPEDDGSLLLVDNGSSNGTFLNGEPIDQEHLDLGDRIGLGRGVQLTVAHFGPLVERTVGIRTATGRREGWRQAAERNMPLFETILELAATGSTDALEAIGTLAREGIRANERLLLAAARRPESPVSHRLGDLLEAVVDQLGDDVHVELVADPTVRGDENALVRAFADLARDGLAAGSVRFQVELEELDDRASRRRWLAPGPYARITLHDGTTTPIPRDLAAPAGHGGRDVSTPTGILRAHEGHLQIDVTATGTVSTVWLPIAD